VFTSSEFGEQLDCIVIGKFGSLLWFVYVSKCDSLKEGDKAGVWVACVFVGLQCIHTLLYTL